MSTYACVKYTLENPTPWNLIDLNDYIDDNNGFNNAIDNGYIVKIMPDEFKEHFEKYSTEELIRQSQISIDEDTSKEEVIEILMDEGDYSWIVSDKGLNYLKSNEFLEFYTNNLIAYDVYEFKLFCREHDDLTFEEIGDEYVNIKLKKGLKKDYDEYLKYLNYYFNLNFQKADYDNACVFLAQRIIYEINNWNSRKFIGFLDEALSIETDNLLFKFRKLDLKLDLKGIYDKAFEEFKIQKYKTDKDENYGFFTRLIDGESIYEINYELAKLRGLA